MAQVNNLNEKYIINYIVDNAIIANTYTVTVASFQFGITMRPGIMCEAKNSGFYIRKIRFIDFL
jgi:hypothetical protein